MRLHRLVLDEREHAVAPAKAEEADHEERVEEREEDHDSVGLMNMP